MYLTYLHSYLRTNCTKMEEDMPVILNRDVNTRVFFDPNTGTVPTDSASQKANL